MARKKPLSTEAIRDRLWNSSVAPANYEGTAEKYQAAVMDQYKVYVEMTDRISARRGLTNTFFLTFNSLIFTVLGVFWKDKPQDISDGVFVLLLAVALAQCAAWWLIVRSYRQLNRGKFQVIGLLEERLPASPYWSAEWAALGEGTDLRRYVPLSLVEQVVPMIFAAVYTLGFVLAVTQ